MNRKNDRENRPRINEAFPPERSAGKSASSAIASESPVPEWGEGTRADGVRFILRPPVDSQVSFRATDYAILTPYARTGAAVSIGNATPSRWTWISGSALFILPGIRVQASMAEPVELLIVMIDRTRAEAVFERIARGRRWNAQPSEPFSDPGFTALQQEVRRTLLGDPLVEPAYLEALTDSMLSRIGCWLSGRAIGTKTREEIAPHVLRRIIQMIESSLDDKLVVEDLAREAGLSRSHFARAFRAATGESPQEFIISRRLCRARDLLSSSNRSIADIALAAGFSSQAHLSTAFKKRIGVSPGHYRTSFRDDPESIEGIGQS